MATLTVTGDPTGVAPLKTVKVSVPSLTTPAALKTVAFSVTFCAPELKVAPAVAAAVVVVAALMIRVWLESVEALMLALPLKSTSKV